MRVTLDTNILVSGTFWNGPSFSVPRKVYSGEIELVLSEALIEEYNNTVNSDEIMEKTLNKKLAINNIIKDVVLNSIIVKPKERVEAVIDDPSDNKVLECALEGGAEYVITKDKHLLKLKEFRGIRIMGPEEFLKILK